MLGSDNVCAHQCSHAQLVCMRLLSVCLCVCCVCVVCVLCVCVVCVCCVCVCVVCVCCVCYEMHVCTCQVYTQAGIILSFLRGGEEGEARRQGSLPLTYDVKHLRCRKNRSIAKFAFSSQHVGPSQVLIDCEHKVLYLVLPSVHVGDGRLLDR